MKEVNTKWIIPIMGFRESTAHETGIEKIWRGLRELVDPNVFLITPYEWDEDMEGLVDFIERNSKGTPELMVIAYSWGCGVGFLTLAQEAEWAGLRIRYAVLADPVYRSCFFPTWFPLNPLSVSTWFRPRIAVPSSVDRVLWVRQCQTLPMGHDLVAEDPIRTKIDHEFWLTTGHCEIDDAQEFRVMADEYARAFVEEGEEVEKFEGGKVGRS